MKRTLLSSVIILILLALFYGCQQVQVHPFTPLATYSVASRDMVIKPFALPIHSYQTAHIRAAGETTLNLVLINVPTAAYEIVLAIYLTVLIVIRTRDHATTV